MRIVQKIDTEKWSKYVYQHSNGNVFQTPEMLDIYRNTKNYDPLFLAAINKQDEILGVMLSVIQKEDFRLFKDITSRSIILGGPLLIKNDPEICDFILKNYNEIIKDKAIYTQFRNLWDVGNLNEIFHRNNYKFEDHLNIIIDLKKSEEQLWDNMNSKRRNQIRAALKRGTIARELTDYKDIELAYKILLDVYAYVKIPFPDKSLFLEIFKTMYPRGMAKFFGAVNKNKVIGIILILTYKKTIYDWYAGSIYEYRNLYPNDLLPWEIIKWGKKKGFEIFDFGGAGRPDENYGVRDFKKQFGGKLVEFGRWEKIHKPYKLKLAKAGFNIWRKFK